MKSHLLASTAIGTLLAATSVAQAEGLNLRVFGGANWVGDETYSGFVPFTSPYSGPAGYYALGMMGDMEFDADLGYVFGGAVGYGWDNGLRIDVEASYRRNGVDITGSGLFAVKAAVPPTAVYTDTKTDVFADSAGTDGHVEATALMANAWYEFNMFNSPLRPFIGGGVGFAWVDVHDILEQRLFTTTGGVTGSTKSFSNGLHGDDSGFAWQLGGGLAWEVAPGKDFTVEYRYFNGPDIDEARVGARTIPIDYDYQAHSVMAGFKVGL